VTIDGKPATLEASGSGTYAIDLTSQTEGPSDESRTIDKSIPYVVTPKGKPSQTGTLSARVSVAPLHVDTPGAHAVVDSDSVVVSGRAAKGSTVKVAGTAATVGPDGSFEATVPTRARGEQEIAVLSGSATLTPRTVRIEVKRVDSLETEATAFEATSPLGYDAVWADVAGKVGQAMAIEGTVVESRVVGHRTIVLVDDQRGCSKKKDPSGAPACLLRVVLGHEMTLAKNDRVRAYGRVTRPFATSTGVSVPEVEADFVLRGAAKK
jgi:hypothetical protein